MSLKAVGKGGGGGRPPGTRSGQAGLWGPLNVGRWDEAQAQLECRGPPRPLRGGRSEDVCPEPRRRAAVSRERRPVSTWPASPWKSPGAVRAQNPDLGPWTGGMAAGQCVLVVAWRHVDEGLRPPHGFLGPAWLLTG